MDSNGIHGENHGENKRYSPGIPMDHWRFDPGSYWVKGRHIYLGRCVFGCVSCTTFIWVELLRVIAFPRVPHAFGKMPFDSFKIYVPIGFDIVGIVDTFQKLRTRQNQRMCSVWSCLLFACCPDGFGGPNLAAFKHFFPRVGSCCSVRSCLPALCHCMLLCKLTCQTRCAIGSNI